MLLTSWLCGVQRRLKNSIRRTRRRTPPAGRPIVPAAVQVLEDRTLLSSIVVTNTQDSGAGSLRQAILDSNANPGANTITFDIEGAGVHVIAPLSALPTIMNTVTIDATTQPGYAGTPLIELDGSAAGAGVDGLAIGAGPGTIVRGLDIGNFSGDGIDINGWFAGPTLTGVAIEDCYLGIDPTGNLGMANGTGLFTANVDGVRIADNVLSGNTTFGAFLTWTQHAVIVGNRIGTNAGGTAAVGNGSDGLALNSEVYDSTIGGADPGDGNLISGNLGTVYSNENGNAGNGIYLAATVNIVIQGNLIGTDITGNTAIGNAANGILDTFGFGPILIGGTAPGTRNVISGNGAYGSCGLALVQMYAPAVVQGNYIGTNAAGTAGLGNFEGIIVIHGDGTLIGGTTPQAGNLISGNEWAEVDLRSDNSIVQGNFIGTDITGTVGFGGGQGVYLADFAADNLIGGTTSNAGNLIAGDAASVVLNGPGVHDNTIQGNRIGSDVTGSMAVPGSYVGAVIQGGANFNVIGGTGPGEANDFRDSYFDLQVYDDSVGNIFRGNLIGATIVQPIGLGGWDGVDSNDSLDADAGPNDRQNTPVISNAVVGTATHVSGVLDSSPDALFTVDFYAGTDINQTLRYIGSTTVLTDGAGHAVFDLPLGARTDANETIFSTATNAAGSTSEMSPAAQAVVVMSDITPANTVSAVEGNSTGFVVLATFLDGNAAAQASNFTVDVNWGRALIGTPTVSVQFVSETAGISTWQVVGSATYAEAGLNPVTVSVSDAGAGSFTSSQTTFTVADAPLTNTTVAATLNATVGVGTGNVVLATFTDGNPYVTVTDLTATVDFGGPVVGTPTASIQFVSQTATSSTWQVVGNVTYAGAGSYTVAVAVNDTDGSHFTTSRTSFNVIPNAAILLLDPTGQGALTDSGNGKIIVGGNGHIVVASTNAAAVVVSGNGSITASELDVESATGTQTSGHATIIGTVDHGVPPSETVDPLAGLAAPTAPAAQFPAANISGDSVVTLQPGTYNGGIQISGNAHVTFAPGIYYLNGGGFSVTGNAVVTGTGVLIYNAAQTAGDSINISGNVRVNLSAATSGVYKGVVFFQARTSSAQIYISGNAALVLTGTLYAAKAKVNVSGNGLLQLLGPVSELIAADLIVSGNGVVKVNA